MCSSHAANGVTTPAHHGYNILHFAKGENIVYMFVCVYVCANSMCPDEIEIMMAHCFCWVFIVFFCSLLFLVNWFFFWYSFDFFPSPVFFFSSLNFCFYFSYQVNKTNQMFVVFVSGSNYIHTSVYTHPPPPLQMAKEWIRCIRSFIHSFIHASNTNIFGH